MTDFQAVLFVGVWCAAIWGCVYSWYRILASIKRDIKGASNAYTGVAPTVHVARSPLGRITSRSHLRQVAGRAEATDVTGGLSRRELEMAREGRRQAPAPLGVEDDYGSTASLEFPKGAA